MKRYLLVTMLGLIFSTNSFAKDELVTIDGKNIKVSGVSEQGFFNSKLHSENLKDGVYVGTGNSNVVRIIKERFALRGIKVAEKIDGSSEYIGFSTIGGGFTMDEAESAAAHSSLPNEGQVIANANTVMVMGKTLGNGGLIGSLVGLAFSAFADDEIKLMGVIIEKPITEKDKPLTPTGSFANTFVRVARVSYSLEKGKEATDDVILKMAVDKWIDEFIVFDAPVESSTAVAITPAVPAQSDTASVLPASAVIAEKSLEQK